MAIRNILLSYNGLPGCDAALALASLLARRFDAHLTGLLSYGPSRSVAALGPWITPRMLDAALEGEAARRAEVARAFAEASRALAAERPAKVHFLELGGDADGSLMQAARVYDMVVMAACESADADTAHLEVNADVVALRSGKPVMIAPKGAPVEALPRKALVAWDGGRAAARALSEAMPLLEAQGQALVCAIGDDRKAVRHEGRDVVAQLARHGIQTEWRHMARDARPIGRMLLDVAAANDCGLLVMGAYEHSKFSEDLVGGVTRTVLAESRIPVLMAH
ncbi:MAG: universal stress protein [Pseudomonadota bacterium]|nr:universal stress protein [Pseudomonadota bacterium]MEE3098339.1 universal stress protein [Pseudomonadota bacterium]